MARRASQALWGWRGALGPVRRAVPPAQRSSSRFASPLLRDAAWCLCGAAMDLEKASVCAATAVRIRGPIRSGRGTVDEIGPGLAAREPVLDDGGLLADAADTKIALVS